MAESKEHVETIGKIWDSLSTGNRILFVCFVLGLLGAVGGAGYWLGNYQTELKLAALEAKHERDLTTTDRQRLEQIDDLRNKLSNSDRQRLEQLDGLRSKSSSNERFRLEQIDDLRSKLSTHVWSKDSGCPDLENAEPIQTSQEGFLIEYLKERCENHPIAKTGIDWGKDVKTTVRMGDFFRKYAKHKVLWEGMIWDVVDEGHLIRLSMVLTHKCPQTIIVNCYFAKELLSEKILGSLQRGVSVSVLGVLNGNGELVKCHPPGIGTGVPASELKLIAPNAPP